jgi:copper transport protein
MRPTSQRRALAIVLAAIVSLWPAIAWAHARLTRSEPGAKAELALVPSMIRLWFSEAPEVALTTITLRDSAGAAIALGPVTADSSKLGVSAGITRRLMPGRYTVVWRLAGRDGHPVSGSYSFVVLASAVARVDGATVPDTVRRGTQVTVSDTDMSAPSAESTAYVATRFATFLALLVLIGAVTFKFGVLDRSDTLGRKARLAGTGALAKLVAGAAFVLALAAAARLQLQQEILSEPSHLVHLQMLAGNTEWGRAWILQVACAMIVAVAAWVGRRGNTGPWTIAALAALILAFTPGLGGHAAAATNARGLGMVADGLHVLGASGWLGSLACLALVGLPAAAHATEGRWQGVAGMVAAFSPVALVCAGIVLLTGVVTAWLRLGAISPLWTSAYGRVLLLKLALMLGLAGTGAYNWLRVRPTLGTSEATMRLRKSVTVELAVGIAVIAVTAVLVALPTPLDPSP